MHIGPVATFWDGSLTLRAVRVLAFASDDAGSHHDPVAPILIARVLRDLGQMNRGESKIILGAAVIDDVLGLLVLAVVTALVVHGAVSFWSILGITAKAVLFLTGSIGIGIWVTPKVVRALVQLEVENIKLLFGGRSESKSVGDRNRHNASGRGRTDFCGYRERPGSGE